MNNENLEVPDSLLERLKRDVLVMLSEAPPLYYGFLIRDKKALIIINNHLKKFHPIIKPHLLFKIKDIQMVQIVQENRCKSADLHMIDFIHNFWTSELSYTKIITNKCAWENKEGKVEFPFLFEVESLFNLASACIRRTHLDISRLPLDLREKLWSKQTLLPISQYTHITRKHVKALNTDLPSVLGLHLHTFKGKLRQFQETIFQKDSHDFFCVSNSKLSLFVRQNPLVDLPMSRLWTKQSKMFSYKVEKNPYI